MPGNYADNTDYTAKRTSKVKKKNQKMTHFSLFFAGHLLGPCYYMLLYSWFGHIHLFKTTFAKCTVLTVLLTKICGRISLIRSARSGRRPGCHQYLSAGSICLLQGFLPAGSLPVRHRCDAVVSASVLVPAG